MAEEAPAATPETPPAAATPGAATDWEARYKEAEAKIGQQGTELSALRAAQPAPAPTTPTPGLELPAPGVPEQAGINDVLTRAGLTSEQVSQQWAENNGQLTPDAYNRLQQQGISRPLADDFIRGQLATAQVQQGRLDTAKETAATYVGGQPQLDTLLAWSAGQLTPAEHTDFNRRLGDPDMMLSAVHELNQRHQQATGGAGTAPLVTGTPAPPSGGNAMTSEEWGKTIAEIAANGGKVDDATMARIAATDMTTIQDRAR